MDLASLIGVLMGFGMMLVALVLAGMHGDGQGIALGQFVDPPALVMVLGGGLSVVLTSVPLKFFLGLPRVLKKIFFNQPEHVSEMIDQLVGLAEMARRDGLLIMENKVRDLKNAFMVTGIQMAVDGTPAEVIEEVMRSEIEAVRSRHKESKKMLETMGRCGPAFGMIATLLGLILMLGNLSDPDSIGPSMAMALVGTLYGAVMANLICIPMAEKLAFLSHEELLVKEIILKGVLGIQAGDNPRIIQQKLNTYLPPTQRKGAHEEAA
jgi:chemotaxis protein MotA